MSKAKPPAKAVSKISKVADMLRREGGATSTELIAATCWQPHTTRAALTGLRKKGHTIKRSTHDGATTWSVVAS